MHKKQPKTARFTTAEILCQLYKNRTPLKPLFDKEVHKYQLATNERNLTMQLVYGVLRKRQFLDRILAILSKTPLKKLDSFIHQALACGLYQIFFLERIPDSAAVNEAVNSCKTKKIHKRLHGFVNGILRQAIREKDQLLIQAARDKSGEKILNHPDWLLKRWRANFGPLKTEEFCNANNLEPTLIIRVNTASIDKESFCKTLTASDISHKPGRYSTDALVLPNYTGSITDIPGFHEGYFQVQDEAAQLATSLFEPVRENGFYLDGCAGLGGKTSHLLQFAHSSSLTVHAVEPETFRLKKLTENIARLFPALPDDQLITHQGSLLDISPANQVPLFDGILIDAPCSGTGVTGRHPDIRWNREHKDILNHQKQQLALLTHGATLLASGGILVYATCSIEPEENREVINMFLESHGDFKITDCGINLPQSAKIFVKDNFFCPLPSKDIDGFFAARLVKS